MHYLFNAYLNESVLDDLTTDDNTYKSSSERVASSQNNENLQNVRITFSFSVDKELLNDLKPYMKLFDALSEQFWNS